MSTKMVFPGSLVLAIFGVCAIRAQDLPATTGIFDGPRSPTPGYQEVKPPPQQDGSAAPADSPGPHRLSDWLSYTKRECCGPVGGDGPIFYELYLRTGFEIPAQGRIFGHVLETGWVIQGGARTLFFNPAKDADWAVDLGVGNIFNRGQHSDIKVPLRVLVPSRVMPPAIPTPTLVNVRASIRELNRTYVDALLGRDWYLTTPEDHLWYKWRVGVDVGGRFGNEKAEFNELPHRQDVFGGVILALHTDWEAPYGCCTFLAGFRAEWVYNWADILQRQNDSDIQDVNLLFTAGVRF
jgi:hypothetical protein